MMGKYFLLMWCCEGFEMILDITKMMPDKWNESHLFNAIKEAKDMPRNPLGHILDMAKLRARVNSQRYYEIYVQETKEEVTEEMLWEMAGDNPQGLADLVRSKHFSRIYSDRAQDQIQRIV